MRKRRTEPKIGPLPSQAAASQQAVALATLCDFTIASKRAVFGQVGPRMGPVDPGFGTAYLARVVGERKEREIWCLFRRYTAAEALAKSLANTVVPHDQLDAEVARWCAEIVSSEGGMAYIHREAPYSLLTIHYSLFRRSRASRLAPGGL